jgi:hypothetical protein
VGINPTVVARTLWLQSHPLPAREITDPPTNIGQQRLHCETKPITSIPNLPPSRRI